jgi:hypothetical protein
MSSLFLSSLFNKHVQHFWFTWRASEPRKARYSMYAQCADTREVGESERRTKRPVRYIPYGPLSRIFEFSTLAGPDHQSRGGRPSDETLRKVCMGSRTPCTDALEIATWRKHIHATLEVRCGVSDLTDILIHVFADSVGRERIVVFPFAYGKLRISLFVTLSH